MLAPAKRLTTGSSTNIAMPLLRFHTFDGIDAECRVFSTILFDHFGGGFLIHATHGRLIGVVIIGRITGDDEDRIGVRIGHGVAPRDRPACGDFDQHGSGRGA